MLLFYGNAKGRNDVSADSPSQESVETALRVFRSLDLRRGFLGIVLKEPFVMQLLPKQNGGVRVELLDTSIPATDSVEGVTIAVVEELIMAAASGKDVFQIARQSISGWTHLKLRQS